MNDTIEIVGIKLGEEEYGLEIEKIREVVMVERLLPTFVPRSEVYYEGVINLRGDIIPVINLKKYLGLEGEETISESSRVVIMELLGLSVGFLIDGITKVMRINKNEVEEPPPTIEEKLANLIIGVGKHDGKFIPILNMDKIIEQELSNVGET